jgi:hypothetical protein
MQRGKVEQMNFIALPGQPAGVGAGAASEIKEPGRSRRQVSAEQFPGALPVQPADSPLQAPGLETRSVILRDLFRFWRLKFPAPGHFTLFCYPYLRISLSRNPGTPVNGTLPAAHKKSRRLAAAGKKIIGSTVITNPRADCG